MQWLAIITDISHDVFISSCARHQRKASFERHLSAA